MEEKRRLNVSFNVSGSGSINTRFSIPKKWVDAMEINPDDPLIDAYFDGEKIVITKSDVKKVAAIKKYTGEVKRDQLKKVEYMDIINDCLEPETIKVYEKAADVKKEFAAYKGKNNITRCGGNAGTYYTVEFYATEYYYINADGEFIEGSDYDFNNDIEKLKKEFL